MDVQVICNFYARNGGSTTIYLDALSYFMYLSVAIKIAGKSLSG